MRAIIADLKGEVDDVRHWLDAANKTMRHLWLSDCESLVSHLKNPKSERLENVRLSIDLQSLKQLLWERSDGTILDELDSADVAENAIRWIDTSCMVVDCLTKKMNPKAMIDLMGAGYLDLKASAWSTWTKLKKSKQRSGKTQEENEVVT